VSAIAAASSPLPPVVEELAGKHKELVLVTGPTGSGKSTTLAAMIDRINSERRVHIVTIEDPIEFVHSPQEVAGPPA
jgi:twitching motility protein PilT